MQREVEVPNNLEGMKEKTNSHGILYVVIFIKLA